MNIYLNENVYVAAKDRIREIYSEFDNISVSFSGGKDSTVILFLSIEVARELGRLPVKVVFVDQEAEWASTIEYMNYIMRLPEVDPYWFQAPFKIFNAASNVDKWLKCWDPKAEDKWIHPQNDISIKGDVFKKTRFIDTFEQANKYIFGDEKSAVICGVRCQESPARRMGLTNFATYKHITWGKIINKKNQQYNFHPIYDWEIKDVWKYIYDNDIKYCKHYDTMYQYGIAINKMRVSNLHHETALASLYILQEVETSTWNRVVDRLGGIHAAGKLGEDEFQSKRIPPMFSSVREYRDYLMPRLIRDPEDQKIFLKAFEKSDLIYTGTVRELSADKVLVQSILSNDVYLTKFNNFISSVSNKAIDQKKKQAKALFSQNNRIK